MSGLICDRRIAEKLIEKIYKAVVRLVQFRDSVSVKNGRGMDVSSKKQKKKRETFVLIVVTDKPKCALKNW